MQSFAQVLSTGGMGALLGGSLHRQYTPNRVWDLHLLRGSACGFFAVKMLSVRHVQATSLPCSRATKRSGRMPFVQGVLCRAEASSDAANRRQGPDNSMLVTRGSPSDEMVCMMDPGTAHALKPQLLGQHINRQSKSSASIGGSC